MCDTTNWRCHCLDPECRFDAFHETDLGVDQTHPQSGNVSLFDCRSCGCRWLHYFVDGFDDIHPARWYRGPISMKESRSISADNAAEVLADLPWYFYGGTDFDTNGQWGSGPIFTELCLVASANEPVRCLG